MEIAKHVDYSHEAAGGGLHYVTDPLRDNRYEVDLELTSCTCAYMVEHRQPCRHVCVVFYALGMFGVDDEETERTLNLFWPAWAQATMYSFAYEGKSVRRPDIHPGRFVGAHEDVVLPPKYKKPRGRPRKKRITKRKRTTATIAQHLRNHGRRLERPEYAMMTACI